MASLFFNPNAQFLSGDGSSALAGALLYSYEAGTTTNQATYSDSDLTTANANPVVADAAGRFGAIYLSPLNYRFVLRDADGNEIWDIDSYDVRSASSGVESYETVAALLASSKASLEDGWSYFVNEANKEGRFEWDASATDTVNNGTIFQSDEGGAGRFFRRDYEYPVLDWFPNTAAGIEAAASLSDIIRVNGDLDFTGETIDQGIIADARFIGEGSLSGVYRKFVVSELAPAVGEPAPDLNEFHLTQLNTSKSPVVALVGDSISTYLANTQSRSGMLAEALRNELYRQAGGRPITFYNFSIGGQGWANLDGVAASKPAWYSPTTNDWLTFPQAVSPDLVVISLGMNGADSIDINDIDSVIAKIKAWDKVPDIVLATNLTPGLNPLQSPSNETQAAQDTRDQAAGLVRSYARYYGYGLLDFGRQHLRVRDGFDPDRTEAMIDPDSNATLFNDAATGDRDVLHVRAEVRLNPAELVNNSASSYIDVKLGAGNSDLLRIFNVSGNYRFRLFAGSFGANKTYYTLNSGVSVPGSGTDTWYIEVHGSTVTVHQQDVAFGQYTEPTMAQGVIRKGGFFTPSVRFTGASSGVGSGLVSVRFVYGLTALNQPAAKNSILWGDGQAGTDNVGGSSWNHPSSYMGQYVYEPVLRANRLFYSDPNEVLDLGFPVSTNGATLTTAATQGASPLEPYASYVQLSDSGASSAVYKVPKNFDASSVRIYYLADNSGSSTAVTFNIDAYDANTTGQTPSEIDLFIGTISSFNDDAADSGKLQSVDIGFNAVSSRLFSAGDELIVARNGAKGSDTYGPLKIVSIQLL